MSDMPPPGVDALTGEILDEDARADGEPEEVEEDHVRPFAAIFQMLNDGAAHADASRGLHDLIAAVRDQGKKGNMTITVEISPLKGADGQVMVAAQVTTKPPKSEPTRSVFFVADDGNLQRDNPNHPFLDGMPMQVVRPKATKQVDRPAPRKTVHVNTK